MRWAMLKRFVFLIFILQLADIAFAQQGPAFAAPSRLVDLGGFQVNIYCVGHGRPPVVFLHGLGDYSFDWALVQPALAEHTEACAYDRPGQAWSEPGPPPRGISTSAHELHLLLKRSNVKGPYILVGHSWGGLIARMYAHEYPKEIAGMVLVDSTHEDEYLWISGKILRPRYMTDEEWADLRRPLKAPSPAPSSDTAKQAPAPQQPIVTQLPSPYDKLPPDAQRLRLWAMSLPWSKKRNEGGDTLDLRQDFIATYKVRIQSGHPLGSIPLIVLSKTPGIEDDDDYTPDQLKWNRDLQDQLATLSTNSQHLVADHSGHHIQLEEPDIVIASILRVVDAVRDKRPLRNEPISAH
ncbi:MAG TPA: alpha/beta hydrolase [Candidatus Acidoferrum sp.]|nr:alpha/beta hydrolase [Candidatus Acidoferrum sp.]